MAVFCQHMLEMALALSREDPSYQDMVPHFVQQFLSIGSAMLRQGDDGMWDERGGFFSELVHEHVL